MKEKHEVDPSITHKEIDLWCEEFYDIADVLEMGAGKYGKRDWEYNMTRMSITENFGHMAHHLAEFYCGREADAESGLHPLLHLATRSLMGYTLWKRGKLEGDPRLQLRHIDEAHTREHTLDTCDHLIQNMK